MKSTVDRTPWIEIYDTSTISVYFRDQDPEWIISNVGLKTIEKNICVKFNGDRFLFNGGFRLKWTSWHVLAIEI